MDKYTCIIVDDVEVDRLTVHSYVKKFSSFEVLGVFDSATEALSILENHKIDIIFLDIDMPDCNGIEFRKKALKIPVCVFITSHPEYAIESFELEALDYIVKPLFLDRFSKTVKRIEEYMDIKKKASLFEASFENGTVFLKEGHHETKVKLSEVLYLEALKNYTLIVTKEKKHRVLFSIGTLLKEKDFQSFIRVHRGFAIQKHFVQKIKAQEIELDYDVLIPIGRSYKDHLNKLL